MQYAIWNFAMYCFVNFGHGWGIILLLHAFTLHFYISIIPNWVVVIPIVKWCEILIANRINVQVLSFFYVNMKLWYVMNHVLFPGPEEGAQVAQDGATTVPEEYEGDWIGQNDRRQNAQALVLRKERNRKDGQKIDGNLGTSRSIDIDYLIIWYQVSYWW